ncbi:hypothetical protein [Sulfobacillus thermosulfidooxidans]|uniref:hypothetical protein n=1 Tax=Sulfobacillus thermosulfidooxidans TaxID=28034 RepID=UPI0006B5D2AF|nr:hypothetical protein [Sulfobacillus thermosulfidooxidans]
MVTKPQPQRTDTMPRWVTAQFPPGDVDVAQRGAVIRHPVYVPRSLADRIHRHAQRHGLSVSAWCRMAITRAMARGSLPSIPTPPEKFPEDKCLVWVYLPDTVNLAVDRQRQGHSWSRFLRAILADAVTKEED